MKALPTDQSDTWLVNYGEEWAELLDFQDQNYTNVSCHMLCLVDSACNHDQTLNSHLSHRHVFSIHPAYKDWAANTVTNA